MASTEVRVRTSSLKRVRNCFGVVTSSFGVPLIPFQFYNIDDGTGEITVVSRSNRAPSKGSRVEVRGKISEIAVFGGRSIGLHIDETNRRIRG